MWYKLFTFTHPHYPKILIVYAEEMTLDKNSLVWQENTRGIKGKKKKNTVNPDNSTIKARLNIWDVDVTDINCWFWSQMGAGPLFLCPGMRRKFQRGTLLGLRSSLACLSHCGSHHSAANIKQHFIQHTYIHTHSQSIHVHISCKGYSEKSNADADISQTCQMHMGSVDEKCFHTALMVIRVKCVKTQACKQNLPFFWKPTMEESCCPRDWWFLPT